MPEKAFIITENSEKCLVSLVSPKDRYRMNWVEGATPWGTVVVPEWPKEYANWGVPQKPYRLGVKVERRETENRRLKETYTFRNDSDYEIDTLKYQVGIYATVSGRYDEAGVCKTSRANAHIWCAGGSSYIMALRMGGQAPHLGLMLTKGSLDGYSVERDVSNGSNDRGDIILHPAPMRLMPGQSQVVEWELFWFSDVSDFFDILSQNTNYIGIKSNRFVYFQGEEIRIESTAQPAIVAETASNLGERRYRFNSATAETYADITVLAPIDELASARVRFIAEKQQCTDTNSPLFGAYLIYDNEERRLYYSHSHDHNAGRERVGMGALLARYLRTHADDRLSKSLDLYLKFVRRELFDAETGTVYNDYGRSTDWHRLYNYSWMIQLFCEAYALKRDRTYIVDAANAVRRFYASGGEKFYPIGLDIPALCGYLAREGLDSLKDEVGGLFLTHAKNLLAIGTDYPGQEVKFEQSIVEPAAEIMLEAYELFGDDDYLCSAREHIKLLKLFNGEQPDYRLNHVAIRHWDDFWFGKSRLLGDTFPHYWSALTGQTLARYAKICHDAECADEAERCLRGPLSLFRPDGSASCAMVYPASVNGQRAHLWDAWANDQDWALYYYLKWHDGADK